MNSPQSLLELAKLLYEILIKVGNALQNLVLLVFRLTWGWQFFDVGKGKLMNHEKIVAYFTSLNIPMPEFTAWFVGGVECFGGLFVLAGLASRPIGWILLGNMTVAYLSVPDERSKVFSIFQDSMPFLQADPFFFWLTALLMLSFGPGLISLDALIGKWLKRKQSVQAP
jgi:putative oxidoreductase